jgi:ABC-type transport system involved in multi-copper enzyme maturation permease subunit
MQRRLKRLTDSLTAHLTLELGRDLGLLLLLTAWAAGLVALTGRVAVGPLVVLWAVWAITFAVLVGIGWIRLCGPMVLYELIREGRKRRYILIRTCYAVALLLLLAGLYSYWTWEPGRIGNITAPEMTRFGEMFFFSFMTAQFLAVLLLTPAYTAGAIAGEKDRGTLEFLLTTDLRKREVVLGKLATRVASLMMLVLAGLPILSFTQFFGGIDPDLTLGCFAVLGLTTVSLAALSLLHSIHAQRARTAIVFTYITTAIYLGLGYLAAEYVPEAPAVAEWGVSWEWHGNEYWITLQSIVDALNTGNIIVALKKMIDAWKQHAALTAVVPGVVLRYAIFHALAALFCILWAIMRVRATAVSPQVKPRHETARSHWWNWPRLESNALLWKELVIDRGFHLHRIGRLLLVALALATLVPPIAVGSNYFIDVMEVQGDIEHFQARSERVPDDLRNRLVRLRDDLQRDVHDWVRIIGTLVACLSLVAVAVRAAGSVSGERDRETLDSLLTTPLNRDAILYSKWLASLLAVRWTWLWLMLMWLIALALGGLSIHALPLLIWAWAVYAMFTANLGLWFSIICRSTLRATVSTLLTLVAICFAHWLLLGLYLPFFLYSSGKLDEFPGWIIAFQKYALTPPLTWTVLAFQISDFQRAGVTLEGLRSGEGPGVLIAALAGICVYGVAASLLWKLASSKFRVLGIAQPEHQGLFPVKDQFFESSEEQPGLPSVEVQPVVLATLAEPVPLATPVDEVVKPELRGAVMIEERQEEGKSGE